MKKLVIYECIGNDCPCYYCQITEGCWYCKKECPNIVKQKCIKFSKPK